MLSRQSVRVLLRIALVIALCTVPMTGLGHPWGGLVVNDRGDVYFSFVCPAVSEDHVACVWLLKAGEAEPRPVLISEHDPSDMVLTRDANRVVYAAERFGSEPFQTQLWRFSEAGDPELVQPSAGPGGFSPAPYTVAPNGTVFFQHDGELLAFEPGQSVPSPLPTSPDLQAVGRINNLAALSNDRILAGSGDDLYILDIHGAVRRLAGGLRQEDPPGLPFAGANILFDMAPALDGSVLLAYYGNREVLRVDESGSARTILAAESPWSPSGVDEHDGVVYVLESTTPPPAWQVWRSGEIRPRVRSVDRTGHVRTLWKV